MAHSNHRKGALRHDLIDKALALLERRIDNEDVNSSLADLVRLLELARESAPAKDRHVIVEFVEPEWLNPENR